MYGLIKNCDIRNIAKEVCECLGGGDKAVNLIVETAGAETNRGNVKDTTLYAGMGLTQFDKLPFQDTKNRTSEKNKQQVKDYFGIDIDLVEWEDLRYSPLLALIFTRLKYKLVPDAIPDNIEDRAKYWKKWYNSTLGKGTIEHYLQANKEIA